MTWLIMIALVVVLVWLLQPAPNPGYRPGRKPIPDFKNPPSSLRRETR